MSLSGFARSAISAALAGAVLAACSNSGSQITPAYSSLRQAPAMALHSRLPASITGIREWPMVHTVPTFSSGSLEPAGTTAKVYVSDYDTNTVLIYSAYGKNQKPIGKITNGINGPLGSFVSAAGTLYVTNINGGTVTVYPAGHYKPSKTYTVSEPISVLVDADGTMYVSEYANNEVVEFDKGATSPSRTISISFPESLWLDKNLNLYVSYNDTSAAGHVMKFKHKATTGTDLGITEGFAGGMQLDPKGNLLLGDQTNLVINVYAPGKTSPTRQINTSPADPYKFSMNKAATLIYVAPANEAAVPVFNYASGSLVNTISQSITSPYGIGNSPPEPFGTPF